MKIYEHRDKDHYVSAQISTNKAKIKDVWISETEVDLVVDIIKELIPEASFGLCHGVRNGWEVQQFRQRLGIEVIGTDISPTASQFENCVVWDMHDIHPDWVAKADFIYSNSLDHSYDPRKCLDTWMMSIKSGGLCFVEWHHDGEVDGADCFSSTLDEVRGLLAERGEIVVVEKIKSHTKSQRFLIAVRRPRYPVDEWVSKIEDGGISNLSLKRFEKRVERTREFVSNHGVLSMLDVGCGGGLFMKKMGDLVNCSTMHGCDIEPGHVEMSRERFDNIFWCDFGSEDCAINISPVNLVVAFGWIHNDWMAKHAIGIERVGVRREVSKFYNNIVTNVDRVLSVGGFFIYDFSNSSTWNQKRCLGYMASVLTSRGYESIDCPDSLFVAWRKTT